MRLDGRPLRLRGQPLILLAMLAIRGERGATRGELVEVLWVERPPKAGEAALDPLLSRLRRVVGPISGRGTIRLSGALEVDVRTALAHLDKAASEPVAGTRLELATGAAATLGRTFAPGADHPWVELQRATLARAYDESLELVADAGLRVGGPIPRQALAAARDLVGRRPLEERPVGMLIDLLAADGDRGAALDAYEKARGRLRAELGVAPGPDLRARHERLLRDGRAQLLAGRLPLPSPLQVAAASPLAGRDAQLGHGRVALAAGQVVLIEGPPGIGKTHLAATLAAERHAAGATVLLARGTLVLGGPLAAMSGALEPLVRAADAEALGEVLGPLSADLAPVLPGLSRIPLPEVEAAPVPDPSTVRLRMFDAVAALLHGAEDLLLVVDDLQDIDPSSVQVLARLVAGDRAARVQLLATARPGAASAATLREAADRAVLREIVLGRLDPDGVVEVVRSARPELGEVEVAALARTVHAHTGGTPLLVRAALSTADPANDLRGAVAAMADWAGTDAHALLRAAALDDTGAPLDVLAEACALDERDAAAAADRARAAGLLAAGTDIVHASVREALLADVGDGDRAALHRRLAAAHERAGSEPAVIAAHYGRGGTARARRLALAYEQRAAERALAAHAAEDAAAHSALALELLGDADPTHAVELLLLHGRALQAASRLMDARTVLRDAQARARELGRADLVAQIAAESAGHRLGAGLVDPELVALVAEGLAVTATEDPLRTRLCARLATLLLDGPLERREGLVVEAERLAGAAGDPVAMAEALVARHVGDIHAADPGARSAVTDELATLAAAAQRPDLALHAQMLRYSDLLEAGKVDEARALHERWTAEARAAHLPYHAWATAICLPTLLLLDEDHVGALAAVDAAAGQGAPLGEDAVVTAAIGGQRITALIQAGRPREVAEEISAVIAGGGATPAWSAARGYCLARIGEAEAARADVAAVVAHGLDRIVDPNRGAALSYAADAAVQADAPPAQLAALDAALARHDDTLIVQHYGGAIHGPAQARRARLAAALDDPNAARAHAAAAHRLAGPRPPQAIARDLADLPV